MISLVIWKVGPLQQDKLRIKSGKEFVAKNCDLSCKKIFFLSILKIGGC
jgi:hypothetical protein